MKALVTGAGGFLGKEIARQLRAQGTEVWTFQRGVYPELEALGCKNFRGDLTDMDALLPAVDGRDVVFHVAAKVGVWGRYSDFHAVNVVGTRHIVEACRRSATPRLVYTSSPSVVFDAGDQEGIDEAAPYPTKYLAHYPHTKAMAERLVLEANSEHLATMSLRPHLIWGPGDRHLVPRIVDRARRGRLRFVGSGMNKIDTTYIDNAVESHILGASHLSFGSPCAGRAYFISNGEPMPIAQWCNRILQAAQVDPVNRSMSFRLAYAVASVLEIVHALGRLPGEPLLTRFLVKELATAHWFDISSAQRDFGYVPSVSIEEGMQRLERSLAGQTTVVT